MTTRESAIERTSCALAKRHGWLVFKWSSPNHRGVPDRIFLRDGVVVFGEFKAPGKRPTKLQAMIHDQLKQAGFDVHVIDSVDQARTIFSR